MEGGYVGEAEAGEIRGDYVVRLGQLGDQVAVLKGRAGEAVEEEDRWMGGRSGRAVEDGETRGE